MNKIVPLFFLFFLVSCSTSQTEQAPSPPVYSGQTENEFSRIESDEAQILEKYRRMREKNWDQYVKPSGRASSRAAEYVRERRPEPPPPPPAPKRPELSEEQIRNIEVEVSQRKSIFCMKGKTVNRFDSESDCQAFVENAHFQCVEKFGDLNYSMLNCLKSRLR
ncbi:MAG: hypothetical protein Fur0010_22260 [Bdellovibrio sp.]